MPVIDEFFRYCNNLITALSILNNQESLNRTGIVTERDGYKCMIDKISSNSQLEQPDSIDKLKRHSSDDFPASLLEHIASILGRTGSSEMSAPPFSLALPDIQVNSTNDFIPGFWFKLSKATPEQIKHQAFISNGTNPNQLIGLLVDDNNNVTHFSFEKITPKTSNILTDFLDSTQKFQRLMVSLLSNYVETDGDINLYKEPDNASFLPNLSTLSLLTEIIEKNNINPDTAYDLYDQIEEIDEGAGVFQSHEKEGEDRFVLYASNRSLKDYSLEESARLNRNLKDDNIENYIKKYGHILMCVGSGLKENCIEHRGIFKTPLALVNTIKGNFKKQRIPVGGLSMALHFFGMRCAQSKKAEFLTVSPVKVMEQIFSKVMDKEIKNNQTVVGLGNISRMGWLGHLRNTDNEKNPIVSLLNNETIKLWK